MDDIAYSFGHSLGVRRLLESTLIILGQKGILDMHELSNIFNSAYEEIKVDEVPGVIDKDFADKTAETGRETVESMRRWVLDAISGE